MPEALAVGLAAGDGSTGGDTIRSADVKVFFHRLPVWTNLEGTDTPARLSSGKETQYPSENLPSEFTMKRLSPAEGYDLYAGDYRKDHPHLDSFMNGAESESWSRSLDALLDHFPQVVAADAGCGDGRTLGRWQRKLEKTGLTSRVTLWGLDVSPRMIEAARGRIHGPRWQVLDLSDRNSVASWRKDQGPAHLVSAFFLLVHFPQPVFFFETLSGLTLKGGRLLMNSIPQPSAPTLRAQGKPVVIEAWDHQTDGVIAAGEQAGFVLLTRRDFHEGGELVSSLLEWEWQGPN
jgi:ubiquinone/menaquinone biosynthesis C-methylase UbiE